MYSKLLKGPVNISPSGVATNKKLSRAKQNLDLKRELSEKKQSIVEKKVSRRSMLRYCGALAGAAVVGAVAGYSASEFMKPPPPPPTSLKPPLSPQIKARVGNIVKELVNRHAGESFFYQAERGACMSPLCISKVRVKDGIIKAIESDDTINGRSGREEVSLDDLKRGMVQLRGCPRPRAMRAEIYSPHRVLYPMKNAGKRGEDKFVRISWTEALDTIATKMKETKEKHGPFSTFGVSSTIQSLLNCGIRGWGACSLSGYKLEEWIMFGFSVEDTDRQSYSELFKSKLIIQWGRHPAFIEEGVWPYYLVRAKEAGVPFIIIDPRYTTSAEALNAQWIPIRPGTDMAMVLAVTNVLLKEGLYEKDYVTKWVEPTGFAKYKDYITGVEDGVDKSPEWAEKLCGVPSETIREFARLYARSKPAMLHFGWEASRSMSTNISRAIMFLPVLTGNLTAPGGGSVFWGGYSQAPDAGPVPSATIHRKNPWTVPTVFNGPCKWADVILLREKVASGQMTIQEYNGLVGGKRDNQILPNIHLLQTSWGGAPPSINAHFDASKRIRAFEKMDFVFGFTSIHKNAEYRYMNIVLPSVEQFEENLGVQGGRGAGNYFIYSKPGVIPQGEARPAEWSYIQLAKRFGFEKEYNAELAGLLGLDEWDAEKWNSAYDQIWKDGYEAWMKYPDIAPMNPVSWEQFNKTRVFRRDALQQGPLTTYLSKDVNPYAPGAVGKGFGTSSGKIEIYSKLFEDPFLAANTIVSTLDYGANMNSCFAKIGSGVTPLPKWHEGISHTFCDSGANQYPLIVISPNAVSRSHGHNFGNALLNGDCYRHACWISVADAKARGVKDGDLVRVYSSVGEMIIPAYVTSRIIPGVTAVYHGGWYEPSKVKTGLMPDGIDRGGNENLLIVDTQPGKMYSGPVVCSGLCQVEKL